MLDKCAPGHEVVPKTHRYWVSYRGKTYTGLPKGPGGTRKRRNDRSRVLTPLKKVRDMVEHLGIDVRCAQEFFPGL